MNAYTLRLAPLVVCLAASFASAAVAQSTNFLLTIGDQPAVELVTGSTSPTYRLVMNNGVPDRRFQVESGDPVLCADYTSAPSSFRIALTDPNGVETLLNGASSVGFNRGTQAGDVGLVHIEPSLQLNCFSFPEGGEPVASSSSDIFSARFENTDSYADLKLQVIPDSVYFSLPDLEIRYTIRVQNNAHAGGKWLDQVRVREFFKATGSSTELVVEPVGSATCTINGQFPCGTLNDPLDLPLSANVGFLRPGEYADITVTRKVVSGGSILPGQQIKVQVAGFANPTPSGAEFSRDRTLDNNTAVLAFTFS